MGAAASLGTCSVIGSLLHTQCGAERVTKTITERQTRSSREGGGKATTTRHQRLLVDGVGVITVGFGSPGP